MIRRTEHRRPTASPASSGRIAGAPRETAVAVTDPGAPVPVRLLIADDDVDITDSLTLLLEHVHDIHVVAVAANGLDAVEATRIMRPDVVLMDLRMPELDGVDATRRIAEMCPEVAVLIHSAYGDESLVTDCLLAGARGYAIKGSQPSELVEALRTAAAGGSPLSQEIGNPLLEHLLETLARERATRRAADDAQRALETSEARFRALVQHSSDAIIVVASEGTIAYESPSMAMLFGAQRASLVGGRFEGILHPDDEKAVSDAISRAGAEPQAHVRMEARLQDDNGAWRHVEVSARNLLHEPHVAGIVLNVRDVGERKALEERLIQQALHDPLTGLANRSLFQDRVRHAFERSRRHGTHLAVLFVDVDDFKGVNDTLGHSMGDRLLESIAQRLTRCVRTVDTVARLGGDEFAVLLEDLNAPQEAEIVAMRVLTALVDPFVIGSRTVVATASVGVAVAEERQDVDGVLRAADLALYAAKRDGKAASRVFEPRMEQEALERLELEADLRHAVERDLLCLHYQPIVSLADERIVAAEALVRWRHPTRGLLEPREFVPLAEQTGLIAKLGRSVVRQACRDATAWPDASGTPMPVHVNISPLELAEPGFVSAVRDALLDAGLLPARLVLEITESSKIEDVGSLIRTLRQLKALGVRIALDDFGTGYSSFAYLRRLPLDILKIDKSFVDCLAPGSAQDGLPAAICTLAAMLGLETVGEGIEHPEQADRLRALGCEYGQGYLYSRPLEPAALETLLAGSDARTEYE